MDLTPIETMAVENVPAYGQGWYARTGRYWAGRAFSALVMALCAAGAFGVWGVVIARLASGGDYIPAMAVFAVFAAATAVGLLYMRRRSTASHDRAAAAPLAEPVSPSAPARQAPAPASSNPLSGAAAIALTPALGGVFLWMLGESLLPRLRNEEYWRYRTDRRVADIYEYFGTSPEMSAASAADCVAWWGSEPAPDGEPALYHSFAHSRMDYSARPTPCPVEAEQTALCGATAAVKCGLGTIRWLTDTYGEDLSVCPACRARVGS